MNRSRWPIFVMQTAFTGAEHCMVGRTMFTGSDHLASQAILLKQLLPDGWTPHSKRRSLRYSNLDPQADERCLTFPVVTISLEVLSRHGARLTRFFYRHKVIDWPIYGKPNPCFEPIGKVDANAVRGQFSDCQLWRRCVRGGVNRGRSYLLPEVGRGNKYNVNYVDAQIW